jgi:hypothetical protein
LAILMAYIARSSLSILSMVSRVFTGVRPLSKLCPLVIVFLFCGFASAQTLVQAASNSARSVSTSSFPFTSNTTAGNLIVVGIDFNSNASLSSVTDSQGNTLTEIGAELTSPGGVRVRLYYAKNIKGGADTVTVNLSTSSNYLETYLAEYSGLDKTAPVDGQAGASGSGGTVSSGNATTTTAGDTIVGYCVGDSSSCSTGSGFSLVSENNGNILESETAGSPGPYAATAASSGGWSLQMVALKPASSSSVSGSATSPANACDLAQPYGTIDLSDVQTAINMSLGTTPCSANVVGANICNVVAVQRVVNAALPGGTCVTSSSTVAHSVVLTWTPSSSSSVTYNVYRTTTSGSYPSAPLASAGSATTYTDSAVQGGQTYYYTTTAVSGGSESARSNEIPAVVPAP